MMPESPDDKEKRELKELEGKNVAHYSVSLSALYQTERELNKTLTILSTAGIGLLVTILTTVGIEHPWELFLYVGAFVGCLVTICSALVLYHLNSKYIENMIRGNAPESSKMKRAYRVSLFAFVIAALFVIAIGIVKVITLTNGCTS